MPLNALEDELQDASEHLERFLQSFFQENAERYAYGDFFEPLYLDLTEFVSRRGKRIRPLLFMLSYRVFGGERGVDDRELLRAAAALEMLHAFILVHDDVIDQSDRRRGLPTFHKLVEEHLGKIQGRERIGQNVALVVGDMLFALAIDTLHRADFPAATRDVALSRFLRYLSDTGSGEVCDILLGCRDITRASDEEIARMYTLKTTRYTFEAPCALGAILAGAPMDAVDEIAGVTDPLGLAFQIQNDLIEYSHFRIDDRAMQTDLLEGKKTMLMRVAYDRLADLDKSFLQLCLSSSTLTDSSILKIRQLIDRSGAVGVLKQRIDELFNEAFGALESSSLTPMQRDGLRASVQFVRKQMGLEASS